MGALGPMGLFPAVFAVDVLLDLSSCKTKPHTD
jgi:hypothetical protein